MFNLLRIICPQLESSLPVLDVKQLADKKDEAAAASKRAASGDEPPPPPAMHVLFVSLLQVSFEITRRSSVLHILNDMLK